jgi:type IV secretion system protein VirB3
MLLCARDARFFDLILLWARTRLPSLFANHRLWSASSYSPLWMNLPSARGRRRRHVDAILPVCFSEGRPCIR